MEESPLNILRKNIKSLIARCEKAEADKRRLEVKLSEMSEQLNNRNEKIIELEKQLDNIRLREAFKSSSKDVSQAKTQIGHLIKEIDKCIEFLEKD